LIVPLQSFLIFHHNFWRCSNIPDRHGLRGIAMAMSFFGIRGGTLPRKNQEALIVILTSREAAADNWFRSWTG
jgi:hypothetical protein